MKPYSIITDDFTKCYICGAQRWIEVHHIYAGALRKKSTQYGCVVPLCHYCHNEPPNGVHQNITRMRYLQRIAQKRFAEVYPDKDFIKEFGRNYL